MTPETEMSGEELLATGLLAVAHMSRGLNGPLLKAKNEELGVLRHQLSFDDMLQHQMGDAESVVSNRT